MSGDSDRLPKRNSAQTTHHILHGSVITHQADVEPSFSSFAPGWPIKQRHL